MSGSGDDADLPDQLECSERYPDVSYDTEGGSSSSVCESEGASYCCLFQDNDSAETCLEDHVTAALWQCIMERIDCSIEDMPCYGGNVSSISAGSSATSIPPSTADGSDEGDVGTADDSSSPTSATEDTTGSLALSSAVADDDDAVSSVEAESSANGAAGTASFLNVLRVGAGGLLVNTVGMTLLIL